MKGNLTLVMLLLLKKQPSTGADIIRDAVVLYGSEPSMGAVYPILESLEKDGLLRSKKQGRKNIFTVTKAGDKELQKLKTKFAVKFERILKCMKLLNEVVE